MRILIMLLISFFFAFNLVHAIQIPENAKAYPPTTRAILFFGGYHSGKDGLVRILTTNNTHIKAIQGFNGLNAIGFWDQNIDGEPLHPIGFYEAERMAEFYNCYNFNPKNQTDEDGFLVSFYKTRMMHSVKKIKMVFSIPGVDLQAPASSTNYLDLLTAISQLLPNIEKFADSIMLVATKSDDSVQDSNIAEFLAQVDKDLQNLAQTSASPHKEEYQRMSRMNQIFQGDDKRAISRRPNVESQLDMIPVVQTSRKAVLDKLDMLKYAEVGSGDVFLPPVNWTNSAEKLQKVLNWTEQTEVSTAANSISVAKDVIMGKINKSNDFEGIHEELRKISRALAYSKSVFQNTTELNQILYIMAVEFIKVKIYLPEVFSKNMETLQQLKMFLETNGLPKNPLVTAPLESQFDSLIHLVEKYTLWYEFLPSLHKYLTSTEFIMNYAKDNSLFTDLRKAENFPPFFAKLCQRNPTFLGFQPLKETNLTVQETKELVQVWEMTVGEISPSRGGRGTGEACTCNPTPEIPDAKYCDTSVVITLATINHSSKTMKNSDLVPNCAGTTLYIFDQVHLEMDEDVGPLFSNLVIVAPQLTIVKPVTITLRGEDGKDAGINTGNGFTPDNEDPHCGKYEELENDNYEGYRVRLKYDCNRGDDGIYTPAGVVDGRESGSIVIVAQQINNPSKLNIISTGGNGGIGESGVDLPYSYCTYELEHYTFVSDKQFTTVHLGHGGNGAQGGWGGPPGYAYIFTESGNISVQQRRGLNGQGGLGGVGGKATNKDKDVIKPGGEDSPEYARYWHFPSGDQSACANERKEPGGRGKCPCQGDSKCSQCTDGGKVSSRKTKCCDPGLKPLSYSKPYRALFGNDFTGKRTGPPPTLKPLSMYDDLNLYRKNVFSSGLENITEASRKLLHFFNTSELKYSYDSLGLVEEMTHLTTLRTSYSGDNGNNMKRSIQDETFLVSLFEQLNKDIVNFVNTRETRQLQMSCETCEQSDDGQINFNDNCGATDRPDSVSCNRGIGPPCSTKFEKNLKTPISEDEKNVLAMTVLSAMSHINSLKYQKDNNLIIDVKLFLEITRDAIREFQVANALTKNYKRKLAKIEEGAQLLKTELEPRIKDLQNKIDESLTKAVDNIRMLLAQAEEDKKEIEASKGLLWAAIGLKVTTNLMDIGASFAAFMGPEAMPIMLALKGVSSFVKDATGKFDPKKDIEQKLQEARAAGAKLNEFLTNIQPKKLKAFDEKIKEIETEVQTLPKDDKIKIKVQQLTTLIADYYDLRKSIVPDNSNINQKVAEISSCINDIATLLTRKRRSTDNDKKEDKKPPAVSSVSKLKQLGNGLDFIKAGMKGITGISDAFSDVRLADEASAQLAILSAKYDQLISTMTSYMKPMVDGVFKQVEKWTTYDPDTPTSLISLDFENFKVSDSIKAMKEQFTQLRNSVSGLAKSNVPELADELQTTMDRVFKTQERIETLVEKQAETDFQVELQNKKIGCEIGSSTTYLTKLRLACEANELLIKEHNYMWLYSRATEALEEHLFPFAYRYKDKLNVKWMKGWNVSSPAFVDKAIKQIESLQTALKLQTAELDPEVVGIVNTIDTCDSGTMPIFEWNSAQDPTHKEKINRLLSGETITMHAPVYKSPLVSKDVIRIKKVDLRFASPDKVVQENIKADLESYFWVLMTHAGYSQFRVAGKYYMFSHDPLPIKFRYKEPRESNSNGVYKTLAREDADWIISPFTTWRIKLMGSGEEHNATMFEQLVKKHKENEIELHLCGNINYFETADLQGLKDLYSGMSEYYDEDEELTKAALPPIS